MAYGTLITSPGASSRFFMFFPLNHLHYSRRTRYDPDHHQEAGPSQAAGAERYDTHEDSSLSNRTLVRDTHQAAAVEKRCRMANHFGDGDRRHPALRYANRFRLGDGLGFS